MDTSAIISQFYREIKLNFSFTANDAATDWFFNKDNIITTLNMLEHFRILLVDWYDADETEDHEMKKVIERILKLHKLKLEDYRKFDENLNYINFTKVLNTYNNELMRHANTISIKFVLRDVLTYIWANRPDRNPDVEQLVQKIADHFIGRGQHLKPDKIIPIPESNLLGAKGEKRWLHRGRGQSDAVIRICNKPDGIRQTILNAGQNYSELYVLPIRTTGVGGNYWWDSPAFRKTKGTALSSLSDCLADPEFIEKLVTDWDRPESEVAEELTKALESQDYNGGKPKVHI